MNDAPLLRLGRPESPPAPRALRAGPLTLVFDGGDLRYVRLGDREVIRRIYAAVRDRNWGTVPPRLSNLAIEEGADGFRVTYDVENVQGEIDFAWRATITGDAAGRLVFRMEGEARSTFQRNRIGLCVLHPASCAGVAAEVEHGDGRRERARFPALIDGDQPVQPFADLRAVTHDVRPGVRAEVRFEGEVFELEDQRNWTDGSFKIFGTPLALPFPVEVPAGTRLAQTVSLSLTIDPTVTTRVSAGRIEPPTPIVTVETQGATRPMPAIGLGASSDGPALDDGAIARLRALGLRHLRVDYVAADPGRDAAFERGLAEARRLDLPVELAVAADAEDRPGLERLAGALARLRPPLARVLVFVAREPYKGGARTAALVDAARQALGRHLDGVPVAAGTNTDFIFFSRNRPPVDQVDAVTFAINPQVHAVDESSLVETLEAQEAAVRTAAHVAAGKPVFVSPVTLKPRFNPYATGPEPEVPAGVLPPTVDPRQRSLFAATWTIGSLRALALSGVSSVTLFETAGWRGLVERASGSPLPALFPSRPADAFPLYHALADVLELSDAVVLPTRSSDRLQCEALAVRAGARHRVLVVNHTPHPCAVRVEGLPALVRVRTLDERNAAEAARAPERWRQGPAEELPTHEGALELDLPGCGLARVDFT